MNCSSLAQGSSQFHPAFELSPDGSCCSVFKVRSATTRGNFLLYHFPGQAVNWDIFLNMTDPGK